MSIARLVIEDERGCFVQVACLRPGRFILEWRGGGPLQDPERGLFRSQAWSPRGRVLHKINLRKGTSGSTNPKCLVWST